MKKFWSLMSIILFTVVGFVLSSCGDEKEENEPIVKNPIVGRWCATEGPLAEAWKSVYIQFKNNGDYTVECIDSYDDVESESGKWKIDGNILSITVDGETTHATIIKITDSELILEGNYDYGPVQDVFMKVSY